MFNVYKNQLRRQTGSRNLTGPKTLPTIWYTYATLVTESFSVKPQLDSWNLPDYKGPCHNQLKKLRQRLSLSGKQDVACYVMLRTPPLVHCKSHGKQEVLWVAFLDPSDSYFLFADLVGLYTH
jgi:hypothetical protein